MPGLIPPPLGWLLPATVLQNGEMVEYRRSAHAVFDLKYHVVWITKYRYKVLCDLNHKVAAGAALCFPALNPEGASWSDIS